jgi:hypothetical protein
MTYIEQAIKEAVEKGGYHEGYHLAHFGDFGDVLFAADKGARSIAVVVAEILLDPSFWQALGKARGWKENALTAISSRAPAAVNIRAFSMGKCIFGTASSTTSRKGKMRRVSSKHLYDP